MSEVRWLAKLSDGTEAIEESGEWGIKLGERKPWVRLCQWAEANELHLISLSLWVNGREIKIPQFQTGRFGLDSVKFPEYYSLEYHIEGELGAGGIEKENTFVILSAHYVDNVVNLVQEISGNFDSWIILTKDKEILMASPKAN